MKTVTKFIYAAFAVVITMGTITANGAPDDLFVTINGGNDGHGFIYQYAPSGRSPNMIPVGNFVRGLGFDSVGNLFVASSLYVGCPSPCQFKFGMVFKIAPNGTGSIFTTSALTLALRAWR